MNPRLPKISVVMSLYNSKHYLKEAIDSVLSQTYTDFELIVIDDGSEDNSSEIVNSYDDTRINLLTQKNTGLATALNNAIAAASSEYIARMDPDDICLPKRLAIQYNYLQTHPKVVLVGSSATCIDEHGTALANIVKPAMHMKGESTLPESPCIHPTVMLRRAAFEKAGGYPKNMRYGGEDAVLFNKMIAYGAIANLPDILLLYRIHPTSMSQKSKRFNVLLRKMVCSEVYNETITESDLQSLGEAYSASTSSLYGYHLYLGKLFLANIGKESMARLYFEKILCVKPFYMQVWLYWFSSYFPLTWRKFFKKIMRHIKGMVG